MTTTDALVAQEGAPSRVQFRSFGLLSILYAAITVAVIPFAAEPGPADPKIVVVYGIGILVADLCTAALLGALYRGSGRPALLVLTCTYLYGGLMAGARMATFPGALEERPLFGGEQTLAWLFLAWRLGVAGLFLAAVIVAAKMPPRTTRLAEWLAGACGFTVAATALIAAIAAWIEVEGLVPSRFSDIATAVQWVAVVFCAAALALMWRKRAFGDLLYLWLGVVLVASIADLTLSNVSGGIYTVGWHASRANFMVSACLLLSFLLADVGHEDRRLARTAAVAAYGGAVAVVLASVFLRGFLDPWLGNNVPFITLYGQSPSRCGSAALARRCSQWCSATRSSTCATSPSTPACR